MTTAAPSLEATSLRCLAVLEMLRGRPDKARTMLADARRVVAELGLRHGLMETELFAGFIELMTGDPVAAEPHFRTALDGLGALGVGADAGQAAALLARAVLAQGRLDEADRYATESERLAGHNLKTAIAWRSVRSEILAAQGLHDAAVRLAREGVAVAADTDLVLDHAEACQSLSRVLEKTGDLQGAVEAQDSAQSLYAAKNAAFLGRSSPRINSPAASATTTLNLRSRLPTANRASRAVFTVTDAQAVKFTGDCVYDDRRRLGGEPIIGSTEFVVAAQRKREQYPHVEYPVVAVRGESLALFSVHWRDDTGNETTSLDLYEVGDDSGIRYWARFDEDDFADAYAELERRYYAREGAEFAPGGLAAARVIEALNAGDLDAARRSSCTGFVWHAPPAGLKPRERSLADLFRWMHERADKVTSLRHWSSAVRWLSHDCAVSRNEISALGPDGEDYRWTQIHVLEIRGGSLASVHEFENEQEAFDYSDDLIAEQSSRLVVTNRASSVRSGVSAALQIDDFDSAVRPYSEQMQYDDRRHLNGDNIVGSDGIRAAFQRMRRHYTHLEGATLAVRGERVCLGCYRCADDAGNESTGLLVNEINEQGLIIYEGRFDEEDFDTAYAKLDELYFAGEAVDFAQHGRMVTAFVSAMDHLDVDEARHYCHPEFRMFSQPGTLAVPERTVEEFFDWLTERSRQVSSVKNFSPVFRWVSPSCLVARGDVRATGPDGDHYTWSRIYVIEFRGGLMASFRQFDSETAAFEYAEGHNTREPRMLIVSNHHTIGAEQHIQSLQAGDADAVTDSYPDDYCFDDRRKVSGEPLCGRSEMRAAVERILRQYNHFDWRVLAVRGEYLALSESRWSDDSGNETTHLHVTESDEHDRLIYEGRFDADDFDGAYRELERRYYAGEGAPFSQAGLAGAEVIAAMNRGDFDTMFKNLMTDDLRVENRSRSAFPDRSSAELRASLEDLSAMLASVRSWFSALCWLSPTLVVGRMERVGCSHDGEDYKWTRLLVTEWRDGRLSGIHDFDVDDENSALACAETLLSQPTKASST